MLALLAAGSAVAACLVAAAPSLAAGTPARPGDFNGDGYPDLAVGAPGVIVNGLEMAGAVSVFYGTATGLDTTKRQRLQQGVSWVPGEPKEYEEFGADHVSADLNADGYSDLAICSLEGRWGRGALMLAFGSPTGLNRAYEVHDPYVDGSYPRDYCTSLVTGDFNADGYPDLAIKCGMVHPWSTDIVYGGPEADHRSTLRMARIRQAALTGQLAAGDVTGDGFADLVVGATPNSSSGGLTLYRGSATGLQTTAAQVVTTPGSSVTAVGDVDGDGFADVAAANTSVGPSAIKQAGLVRLWFGSSRGLDTTRGFTMITQDTPGVPDVAEAGDGFGSSLAIGDADGDGYAELAIASGAEDIGTSQRGWDAGTVTVLYGRAGGLDFGRRNHISQDSPGVPDSVEPGDQLGSSLLFRDFDRTPDGRADLVVGDVREDGQLQDEGGAFLLKTTGSGLSGQGAVLYGPRQLGISPERASFGTVR